MMQKARTKGSDSDEGSLSAGKAGDIGSDSGSDRSQVDLAAFFACKCDRCFISKSLSCRRLSSQEVSDVIDNSAATVMTLIVMALRCAC